jgi:redox-sensitive bicupin YhaK (pirin superfamily)
MGNQHLDMLDPFLMLDEFHSDDKDDYIAGFPSHPHRGFETVTYIIAGKMRHKDNAGHEGVIEPGGVQWMTAAKGIVHSEMPEQEDGLLWGFQLWVNLPSNEKMGDSKYQEFKTEEISHETRTSGCKLAVIAGSTSEGTDGPVKDVTTHPHYFVVEMPANSEFIEPVSSTANAFVYVYDGFAELVTASQNYDLKHNMIAVLGNGNAVKIKSGADGAKFLLVSGQPVNEPVAWGGPFVMNTEEEVYAAYEDYQNGRF